MAWPFDRSYSYQCAPFWNVDYFPLPLAMHGLIYLTNLIYKLSHTLYATILFSPTGVEFNCMVKTFLCPWHWLLIYLNTSIYPNTKIVLVIIYLISDKIDKEIHRKRFTKTSEQFGEGCRKQRALRGWQGIISTCLQTFSSHFLFELWLNISLL